MYKNAFQNSDLVFFGKKGGKKHGWRLHDFLENY